MPESFHTGRCLCGAVKYHASVPAKGVSICHCSQCRTQSGHLWASAYVPDDALSITGPLTWFSASPNAKRGFCSTCGSFLFWKGAEDKTTSFSLGSLDAPTGLKLEKHIFTADKGDYYEICDGLPQKGRAPT